MSRPAIPLVALARVATAGGPYRVGETLALAYVEPTVGRLLALEPGGAPAAEVDARIPETISVVVVRAAEPFVPGETLAFAFVDPTIARVHRIAAPPPRGYVERRDPTRTVAPAAPAPGDVGVAAATVSAAASAGIRVDAAGVGVRTGSHVDAAPHDDAAPRTDARADVVPRAGAHADAAPRTDARADTAAVGSDRDDRDDASESDRAVGHDVRADDDAGDPGRPLADDVAAVASPLASVTGAASGEPVPGAAVPAFAAAHAADAAEAGSVVATAASERETGGLVFAARWSPERVRRVAQVVTRLFAIERLGWFRHALAVRVLLADEATCADGAVERDAVRHLQALRAASLEALGRPLLAASMPNFSLSAGWLASLETAATARAVAGLRDAALAGPARGAPAAPADASRAVGSVDPSELAAVPAGSVDAILPLFIPTRFASAELTEIASAYRREALDAFAQVADANEAVRLNGMARANRALDDRLSLLVRALGEACDGLAVA